MFRNPLAALQLSLKGWHIAVLLPTLLSSPMARAQTGLETAAGLGVFGPVLGIHGGETLAVGGDVLLKQATIPGTGTLAMRSQHPQQLIAYQSEVTNLAVQNPTRVTLTGDLRVSGVLTLDGGIFDARTATLILDDSSQLRLLRGAHFLAPVRLVTAHQPLSALPHWVPIWAVAPPELLVPIEMASRQPAYSYRVAVLVNQPYEATAPPPESQSV